MYGCLLLDYALVNNVLQMLGNEVPCVIGKCYFRAQFGNGTIPCVIMSIDSSLMACIQMRVCYFF